MSGLIATKLRRPSIPAKRVQRPRIIQRLNEGLEFNRQVTLVSAPAGFGKTTCVAEWVNTLVQRPVSWLSLDASDDDPGRFITYFITALQKVDANLGQEIEGALHSGQLPPSEIVSATLINDILACKGQFLVVLDDFHVIQDAFIFQVFEQLIANFPHPLHLVLITREDPPLPLARLRANNQLTEIRARDLRFRHRDIDCFLNKVMGLSLSQADVARLEDKTEGWVAGLQLAGLSVRDREDPSGFIAHLSGSHRFILDYLTEQVLSQQPEEIQEFLLQTSILDKLSGNLCDAVTGRKDSAVWLERLFTANLFLIPLDDEGQWYRYHHLFGDLLRNLQNRLQKEKTADLQRRASHWYAQAGMVGEAIQHALDGADYEMALDLLESHAMEIIMQGFVKTVERWARAIPDQRAWQSPKTNLAFTWMHILRGDYAQAVAQLERLRTTLEGSPYARQAGGGRNSLKAEWLAMRSLILYRQGKATECGAMAAEALEIAPEPDRRVRSLGYYALASAYALMEDYSQAVDAYRMSIREGQAGKNPMAEMMSTVGLAGMALEHGQLKLAFEIASQAVERIERSGAVPPISAVVYAALGDVHYQWHQLEAARGHLLRARRLSILSGANTVTIFSWVLLSRLSWVEGELEAAAGEIQKATELIPVDAPEYVRQEVIAQQVCIYLARNHPEAAEMALQSQGFSFRGRFFYPDLPAGEGISYALGHLYNSSLHTLLYQARAGNDPTCLKTGIELADGLNARAFKGGQLLVALETLLLRAQMYTALGDSQASQADYASALVLAEPEGFIGIFVEHGEPVAKALADLARRNQLGSVQPGYVERILEAFRRPHARGEEGPAKASAAGSGSRAPIEAESLVEPLTERELDVLRLMAEGLKYKEIAAKLFVSQNTVRFHVKAIYGKLNVNNRTRAVARARKLQIL
jgi:LuxR family maltose regulon positive regulatory protein